VCLLYMAISNVPLQCVKRCALNIQICPQVNPKPVQTGLDTAQNPNHLQSYHAPTNVPITISLNSP
jgi:hypothetical protein